MCLGYVKGKSSHPKLKATESVFRTKNKSSWLTLRKGLGYNPFKGKFSGSKLQHVVVFNYKKTTFWILLVVKLAFKLISGL